MNISDEALDAAALADINATLASYGLGPSQDFSAVEKTELRDCFSRMWAILQAAAPFLVAEAVKAERKRCALIAEDVLVGGDGIWGTREAIAEAIRNGL